MSGSLGAVVVRTKINSLLVEVLKQFVRELGQANFCVTHGGGVIAIDRAKVTLAIDQHVAQREVLGHSNDRVVDR